MVKAVAFDFGGVIEIGAGRRYMDAVAEILNVPVEDFKATYFTYNYLSNVQNLPWEDMFLKVVSEYDARVETQERIKMALRDLLVTNTLNTELVSLFPILRTQGLKVGILSNATTELTEKLKRYDLLGSVDAVVVSGEIGFQKPHKEAFNILFNRLTVSPEEVVFVDDSPKSLEKAEEIGYTPILFQDNDLLKDELSRLGIAV